LAATGAVGGHVGTNPGPAGRRSRRTRRKKQRR